MADAQPSSADYEPYFDKTTQLWCYEDTKDGIIYEHDGKSWQPSLASLAEKQAKAYSVQGVDDTVPVNNGNEGNSKKRKRKEDKAKETTSRNTAVYCSRLPLDATSEEIAETFSKAGMILVDNQGKRKIKMYTDESGRPKGEALVVYLQEASADLAVTLLDQTELRIGQAARDGVMTVIRAQFSRKPPADQASTSKATTSDNATASNVHSAGPSLKRKRGAGGNTGGDPDKAATQKQAEKLKQKLEGWESDDELEAKEKAKLAQKPQNTVLFTRMFTLEELESDPTLLLELKEDVRDECENFGKVTNVILYDKEPEGIMTVRFADPAAATACIAVSQTKTLSSFAPSSKSWTKRMQGRNFGGRKIGAFYADPKIKYRRSGKNDDITLDKDELERQEKQRLEGFAKWLESEGAKADQTSSEQNGA